MFPSLSQSVKLQAGLPLFDQEALSSSLLSVMLMVDHLLFD